MLLCSDISTFNNIMYMYCHHSNKKHLEVVQWLIKNAKLNDDTAGICKVIESYTERKLEESVFAREPEHYERHFCAYISGIESHFVCVQGRM